jgi:hypothetical protein
VIHDPSDRPPLYHFRQVRQREDWALITEREVPTMRQTLLVSAVVFLIFCAPGRGQEIAPRAPFPPEWLPSGEVMYRQFCAACHGAHAKGNGPVASTFKKQLPDLTTLAKRHGGFPYDYVSSVLRFGPGSSAHGSSDMPTWGPIFQTIDKKDERAAQDRIRNLADYLASLQRK